MFIRQVNFHEIDRLRKYDVIVWMDASISLHNRRAGEIILKRLGSESEMMLFTYKQAQGSLFAEVFYTYLHDTPKVLRSLPCPP